MKTLGTLNILSLVEVCLDVPLIYINTLMTCLHAPTTKRHTNSFTRWQTSMSSVSSTHSCHLDHEPSGNTVRSSHDKSCDTCFYLTITPISQ